MAKATSNDITPVSEADKIRTGIANLRSVLNTELVERDAEIDMAILALLTRYNAFLLGAPGTAKTMTVDRLMGYIGGVRYATVQFSRSLPPEEMLGPIALSGLLEDRYERNVTGYFPDADVALADEGVRASSSLLSALLMLMNERRYRNAGKLVDSPLATMFVTANSMPEDRDELGAFWDRIVFRRIVAPPSTTRAMVRLLRASIPANPVPIIEWSDFLTAQTLAAATPVSDAAVDALIEITRRLNGEGIETSPRKMRQTMTVIACSAWLAGADEAQPEHLESLVDVLWENPEQIRTVENTVLELVSPHRRKAIELRDDVMDLSEQVDAAVAAGNIPQINELVKKVTTARTDVGAVQTSASGRAAAIADDLVGTLNMLQRRLLVACGLDPDIVATLKDEG